MRFDWLIALFALLVQQGAFLSLPMVMNDVSLGEMRDLRNPFNTAGVALTLFLVGGSCFLRLRQISYIARTNVLAICFSGLVVLSAIWSIHPGITIRRGAGYVLSMLVAAYLPSTFRLPDVMRLFSLSFAISALGSFLFVVAFPEYGIMQQEHLAGTWRGVFPHKEVLGPVMAVAVFVELYILASCPGRQRWRFGLLAAYFALILLSRSLAALLMSVSYITGACIYLIWKRNRSLGLIGMTVVTLALMIPLVIFLTDPDLAFSLIGKDATLTGRTELWPVILELIEQKPLLGWGYRAGWQPNDPISASVANRFGWSVPSSHNAFLEVGLQLGLVGVTLVVLMICVAVSRGVRCCARGFNPLGWFSLMFFIGIVVAGQVLETIGQNQVIDWVLFNTLLFTCGLCLMSQDATFTHVGPLPR